MRPIARGEAAELFRRGRAFGMVSHINHVGVPKYVWAVADSGKAYEAKTKPERGGVPRLSYRRR